MNNHQKQNQNRAYHSPIKNIVASIIVWIITILVASLVLQNIFPRYAGADLLQFPPRSTKRPIHGHQSGSLLPPNGPRKKPSLSSPNELEKYDFYLHFMVAYSTHKNWEVAQLLFSRNEPNVCEYFRVRLLKDASLQATCHYGAASDADEKKTKGNFAHKGSSTLRTLRRNSFQNNTRMTMSLTDWTWSKERPIIACHFLPNLANNNKRDGGNQDRDRDRNRDRDRVDVNPRVLINYQPDMNVLVVAANQESTNTIIEQVQPEINTNYKWTLASRINDSHMNIEDIYGIFASSVPIRNYFAIWSQSEGLSIDYHKLLGPSNFEGRTIRVTTVEGPPVVYVDRSSRDGIIKGRGYLPDIFLDTVTSNLNITVDLTTPPDNGFGSADENGNWNGMVGMLQRKEAEVALMSFSFTAGRKAVMDFSPPVEYSSARLLIRKDWQNNELKWKAYSDPFEWKVWLAIPIIVSLGVCTFIVFAHFKLMRTTPGESVWFLSVCFLQQGQDEHASIRNFPGRVVMGSFWILAVVLYASYTARLTSFLAAANDNMPINSLNEAVDNRNWKIGLVKGTSVPDRVKDSPVPEMMKMWKRIQVDKSGYVSGFKEGISRVYTERFVFFTTELIPSFLVKGNCSYTWVPGKYFSGFGYMGFQKNLPYAASISSQVAKIRETGQMKRLMRKWWGAESSCSIVPASGGIVGMSLYETGTAFIVLICGAILATTFLLMELGLYLKKSVTAQTTIEGQSLQPSFSTSSNSSQASIQIPNVQGGKELLSNKKIHHPADAHHQNPNNTNSIFLQLATPIHYLLRNDRNSSMSTKWGKSKNTESPFAINF